MCKDTLLRIYEFAQKAGSVKSQVLERFLGGRHSAAITIDDERNEPEMYAHLFGGECQPIMEALLRDLMRDMKGMAFEQAHDQIRALSFLQFVAARGLWKYRQNVGSILEEFVREFDRLDVESERMRLHEYAQSVA